MAVSLKLSVEMFCFSGNSPDLIQLRGIIEPVRCIQQIGRSELPIARVDAQGARNYPRRKRKGRTIMRSDLIFGALTHVTNRYELCQLASKATRKLHKPNTRLQDTTNEVLDRFKDSLPMDASAEPAVRSVPVDVRKAA
jgi:hypothetical protein